MTHFFIRNSLEKMKVDLVRLVGFEGETARSCLLVSLCLFQFVFLISCGNRSGDDGESGAQNRLAASDSPYLREHSDNPVNWYEWGSEALRKAKKENKPLIISIGYASCHWCHVMEEESFMDTAVARVMNENFISIKIDREQRPDIDQIYLNAAQLISGHAGWPLNAFALPDGRPFYAGTYFPKLQWLELLQQVSDAYEKDNPLVIKQAEAVTRGVQNHDLITTPSDSVTQVDRRAYMETFDHWSASLDFEEGGLLGEPKFPIPVNWEFLLQYHVLTGNEKALEVVNTTLYRMANGGIYDHLEGGFFRYSTDSEWRVPHFEKMLYDNAQLVSLYAHAYRLTKDPLYKKVAVEILLFVEKNMLAPDGGFYSSLNADSEGEEGKYYIWTKEEVTEILENKTAALVSDYYHITDAGNWEDGRNVLYTSGSSSDFAKQHNLTFGEWDEILMNARRDLVGSRNKRVRPSTDDKVLTSWNALMLMGCVDGYLATGDIHYLSIAQKNGLFLKKKMIQRDGALWRNYKDGKASIDGFLDDYALLAQAFIQLYQVTFDIEWLQTARSVTDYALHHFQDPGTGMFHYTSDRSGDLIARKMELTDQVIPSSNSILCGVLFHLGELYQDRSYTVQSKIMLNHILQRQPGSESLYYANWLRQAAWFAYEPYEVAVLGDRAAGVSRRLQENYIPLAVFMGGSVENLPLLENKYVDGKTIIYVCRNRVCRLPVEDVEIARGQLVVHEDVW